MFNYPRVEIFEEGMREGMQIEDIAEAIAFVASERAHCMTGDVLNVCAGNYMRT